LEEQADFVIYFFESLAHFWLDAVIAQETHEQVAKFGILIFSLPIIRVKLPLENEIGGTLFALQN
jgi:hypothetical protein